MATPAPAPQNSEHNDLYSFPWTGVVVNIVKEPHNGKAVGNKEYRLKCFSKYKPLDVGIFWDDREQTVQAIVNFESDWIGFENEWN